MRAATKPGVRVLFPFTHSKAVRRLTAAALFFFYCASLSVFTGCASSGDKAPEINLRDYISTVPMDGTPVFLGISSNLQNQQDENAAAVLSAAAQAARYIELTGRIVFRSSSGGGFTLAREDIQITENAEIAARAAEAVEVLDYLVLDIGTLARCRYTGAGSVSTPDIGVRDSAGYPTWLERVPETDGFIIGVGSASRSRLLSDSIEDADRSALSELLYQLSLQIQSDSGRKDLGSYGTLSVTDNSQIASGTLKSYYILDRWISDDEKTYYSLAVCPL